MADNIFATIAAKETVEIPLLQTVNFANRHRSRIVKEDAEIRGPASARSEVAIAITASACPVEDF